MFRKLSFLTAFVLLLGLAANTLATDYYVATDGDDNDDGSIGSPFGTVQKGFDTIQPGDTLYLRGGTYYEHIYIANYKQGDENNWFTVKSYPGEWAIIDPQYDSAEPVIRATGGYDRCPQYWIFESFEVTGGGMEGQDSGSGIRLWTGTNIIFRYLYIHDNEGSTSSNNGGIVIQNDSGTGHDIKIEWCHLKDNACTNGENCANITLFSDYVEDPTNVDINKALRQNEICYNLIEGSAVGIKYKNGQFLSLDHSGTHTTYNDYGDKVHHNIIRNQAHHAMIARQDFMQIYNNIFELETIPPSNASGVSIEQGYSGDREKFYVCFYNNTLVRTCLSFYRDNDTDGSSYVLSDYGDYHPHFYCYNNIIEDIYLHHDNHDDLNILFTYGSRWVESEIAMDTVHIEDNYFWPRTRTENIINLAGPLNDYSADGYESAGYSTTIYANETTGLHKTGSDYKCNGSHVLEGSTTIADGGIGGSHPYLSGVTIPSYLGGADPADDGWIDDVLDLVNLPSGGGPPSQAGNPNPGNGATDVSADADLSWTTGSGATSHDVYFGTDSTPDSGEFQGNQAATTFEPGTMSYDTTYYWRIDEINAQGTTTGSVWNFTTETAPPAVYYVDQGNPAADDANPGTEALPWETLLKACQTVVAGDTVYVKEGVYIDTVNSFERKFKPTNTGTAANPITFISSPQLAAVIRSDSLPSSRSDYAWGLSWGSQYIIVDGFKIEGGIVMGYDGCDHCTIRDCELIYGRCPDSDPSLNWGIALHHANDCIVENNYVHDMTDSGNNAHNTACIMMFGNCDRTIIQGNTADASNGIIYNAFGQKGGQMDHNIWRYNLALNATAGFLGMASTDETRPTEDNTYYQNIAVNCDNAFFLDHMAYRFVIYNNTAVDCDKFFTASKNTNIDTELWNNILVGTNYRAIWWSGYPDAMPFSTLIDYSNYNCFYNNAMIAFREKSPSLYYYTLNDWQTGTGFDMDSIVDDPLLVGGGDYHLQGSSPCINAGVDLQDYDDDQNTTESINMGAYITGSEVIGHNWGPTAPSQATDPGPADSATDVSITADLSWTAGSGATSHDVYFGTDSTPDAGEFQGNQTATTYEPGTMANSTTYYWRIDEVNAQGTTTGNVWNFTTEAAPTPPGQASNPSPADSATDVSITGDLSWTAGSNTTSHDVYFGTTSPGTFQGNQTATTYDPGTMANGTSYYWRIDEINAVGTTTGIVWSFTTETESTTTVGNTTVFGSSTTTANRRAMPFTMPADGTIQSVTMYHTGGSGNMLLGVYTGESLPDARIAVTLETAVSGSTDWQTIDLITPVFVSSGTTIWLAWVYESNPGIYYEVGTPGRAHSGDTWSGGMPDPFGSSSQSDYIYSIYATYTPGDPPPGQASSPSPADSATDVSITATLSWTAGADATSRDVYFGTSSPGAFQGNQTATTFDPGTLSYDVTYYWRIDEVNTAGTTTGNVWSFTTEAAPTPPGQATNPDPADSATDVNIIADLSWTAGTNSTSSDVYFGTTSPGTFQGNQTATTFDPGTLDYDTTYYWRIDEINLGGTTTGNVWSFTTTTAPVNECDNWQTLHPEWIFCDDFETEQDLTVNYHDTDGGSNGMSVTTNDPYDGLYSLEQYYTIGQVDSGWISRFFADNPHLGSPGDKLDEVYYRWYHKFEEGFSGLPPKMAKVKILRTSDDWGGGLAVYQWTASSGPLTADIRTYNGSDYVWLPITYSDLDYSEPANIGIWICIEVRVKSNTVGQSDGEVQYWADGQEVLYETDLNLQVENNNGKGLNMVMWDCYWNAGSPVEQSRFYDNLVISTAPIGQWTPGPQPPGQASNPSPADSATDVAVDADLSWTAGTDSTSSDVYFGTTSPGTFQGNQTATTFDPGTMANDTTYYWRIDEVNGEGTTTGVVWNFTTIVAAPGQASSPSPADSAADIAVDADLSWTAGSGAASHDVYFGTSSPGTFQGNQAATTFDTGAMSNDTTYYWRIDEVNAGGTTTGSVWSFTTIVAAPGQASSPSPGTGASDIAVDTDLSWTAGSGATSHDVYFGTSSPGSYQGNQAATTFDTGAMSNDTTYYWRIDEVNAAGTTTGTVWNFTTIVAAPGPATSPSPGNGATDVAVNADLSWTAGSGATSHDVYFGTSSPGSYQGNQVATTFDPGTMANDTTYYWRIDEVNAGGTTTGTVWSFTTIVAAPGQASSPSPGNGATDVDINANLSWTAGSGAASHDVYFGTSSPGSYQGNQAATTFDPGTMANDTTYYWRIDEVNAGGTTAGTVWSFTTIVAAPGQASSPSPANAAADVDIDANLSWTAGSGAASHDVYFGTSSPGTFQGNQAATTFEPGTMAYDTTYYWRIDEINVGGTTTGAVWNFTTESAPLPPPGQASGPNPADSATNVGVGADLSWTAGSNATSRDVYFGTSSPGTFQGNQTAVTFDPGTMDNETTYYWRIDEINASGTTTGVVWSFTTVTAGGQVTEEFGDATNTDHPGTIEDTYTNVGEGGSVNYSTDVTLNTYTWPADIIANTTIIKWDLSSIPTDATIIDATLYLYQVDSDIDSSYDISVHKVINVNPVISACSWNTYDGTNSWTGGADGGQSDIASAEDTQSLNLTNNEYKNWSVTNMVADWVLAPSTNYGMLVNSDDVASIDSLRYFASTEVVDASTRPKLIVTYTSGVAPPGQASSPSPADSATDVAVDTDLSWTAGSGADSHDVYFGTSSPGAFQGNQTATTFDTGSMSNDTTYYWRIDEVNSAGTTTGAVWSFTTIVAAPGQASNPGPADSATDVSIDADLSWTAGTGATSSDVYFGTTSPGTFQGNQTATTFEPGTMSYDTTYYWRIDEINVGGTTTGAVWSFTTEAAPPPLPGQAANPSPTDSATDVAITADLSWTAGSDATSRDVYFGTTSPGTFQGNQTAVTFDPGTMDNDTTYYWRIDEINSTGTTTGVVWSFTTIVSTGDEIIGWWEMDDASGGTATDSSTYGNDGTLFGSVNWTDDAERGWCLDFAGSTTDYVAIPNESFFDLTGPMTAMAWIKSDYFDWRNLSTIIAKGTDNSGGWALQKAGRDNGISFFVGGVGLPWDGVKGADGVFDNQWHHVAGVYDGSKAYVYLDGVDTNSLDCSGSITTNDWDVYIGLNADGMTRAWDGLIDDVRVYNYALTQSEVNDIYTGGPTPPGQASNPSPANSATDVSIDADLSWTAGTGSTSSDVYFGTTSPGSFQGNQTETTFDPGTMSNDTTYYWRIDEINEAGTTTGNVWSFTTVAAPSDVEIIGSWVSGTNHTAESGTNRLLVFTAHAEDNNADMNITSVTYGGQTMTEVIEENIGSGYRAYASLFILNEAGINAASGSSFVVTWADNPNRTPAFTSVFMQNVNQTSPVGASDSNGGTTATISTTALSTNDGDMVVLAATCGNTGTYSVNNSFTETVELSMVSADGVAGYKAATGANETPSVTHSNINRQVIAGLVVQVQ